MEKKPIKDVQCKGRHQISRHECQTVIYQSDGEFLKVGGKTVNPDLDVQRVVCDKCGYTMVWMRNEDFIKKSRGGNVHRRKKSRWRPKID